MSYSYPNQQNLFQYWTNLQIDIFGGYFESPNGNFTNQRYDINRGHCGGMYENFMLHIINNTGRLIKQCDAEGKFDFSATMRIVQTYNLRDFTDAYGPVPFLSVFKTAGDAVQPSSCLLYTSCSAETSCVSRTPSWAIRFRAGLPRNCVWEVFGFR